MRTEITQSDATDGGKNTLNNTKQNNNSNHWMKKSIRLLAVYSSLFLILISSTGLFAQVSITSTTGPGAPVQTYTSFKAGIDAINAGVHTGLIDMRISANITETVTSSLNASGVGGSSFTSISIATYWRRCKNDFGEYNWSFI